MSHLLKSWLGQQSKQYLDHEEGADSQTRRKDFTAFIERAEAKILALHREGIDGARVAEARSDMMDEVLAAAFAYSLEEYSNVHGQPGCKLCLIALGGYGRQELFRFSDIDISFLYPNRVDASKLSELQSAVSDGVLYLLWDLGFKVGHSTRSFKETFQEAEGELKSKNALMDARLVAGCSTLFGKFEKGYKSFCSQKSSKEYLQKQLENQKKRHAAHANTVFLQEPDIKESVGGLRDYQSVLWMAQSKFGARTLQGCQEHRLLSEAEMEELSSAYAFLLKVRHELHYQSKRPTDCLSLEKQPEVALALGYQQETVFDRVKVFMGDYYRHADAIYRITQVVEKRLLSKHKLSFGSVIESLRKRPIKWLDGFIVLGNGELAAESETTFFEDPVRLVRVFRHSQQLRVPMEYELESLIRKSLKLLTEAVICSKEANDSFLAILEDAGSVYPILDKMHHLGVLGQLMPEFRGITYLIQHEYYHLYTVDRHTLHALEQLDLIFTEEDPSTLPYHRALHDTESPELLYLILLLHDIGKAQGVAGHAETGANLAEAILQRLNLPPIQRETVIFVIRHHLAMSRFWTRFDIDDACSIQTFAQQMQEADRLRYLYVHTYCDSQATNQSLWNAYKETLHKQLFLCTLAELEGSNPQLNNPNLEAAKVTKTLLYLQWPKNSIKLLNRHCQGLPNAYFTHYSAEAITLHVKWIEEFHQQGGTKPLICWHDDLNLSTTSVCVISSDETGLFYKIAGALSLTGVNILSSRVFTRDDNVTLDTFYVCDPMGGPVERSEAPQQFEQHLIAALSEQLDLAQALRKKAEDLGRKAYLRKTPKRRIPIKTKVDVYQDDRLKRDIAEVQTKDRMGLLFELSKGLFDEGYSIIFARIATESHIAQDTFYIEESKANDSSSVDKNRQEVLQKKLLSICGTNPVE